MADWIICSLIVAYLAAGVFCAGFFRALFKEDSCEIGPGTIALVALWPGAIGFSALVAVGGGLVYYLSEGGSKLGRWVAGRFE